jgi:A/G-specific adenine glycosylase
MTNFPLIIREWYLQHGRRLPWRETNDPYKVWISEIILQQTQVKQGLDYYRRFIEIFPDVQTLASTSETQLMQLWQGLGYYSRARNLHHAAKTIVTEHNGTIPQTYKKIKTLKGIGPYTAAAIASFAFNLPYAVIDGNVFRLLSRIFAIDTPIDTKDGKKRFSELAERLLDKNDPGTHNQAIMDLGALICKPAAPLCQACPLAQFCKAFATGTQANFPVKIKKISRKKRYLNFIVFQKNHHTIIQKRTGKDIWQGLYQFPLIETAGKTSLKEIEKKILLITGEHLSAEKKAQKKHLLTHQELHTIFYNVSWPLEKDFPESFENIKNITLNIEEAKTMPFPQLIRENLKNIL